jgi:hypothetical protein
LEGGAKKGQDHEEYAYDKKVRHGITEDFQVKLRHYRGADPSHQDPAELREQEIIRVTEKSHRDKMGG